MKKLLTLLLILLLPAVALGEVGVTVTDETINTVNPLLFGDNLSWRGDGYGLWDAASDTLDASLIDAFARSGITHLRYPGGIEASYFHWQETIGTQRIPQIDPFSMDWPTEAGEQGARYHPGFGFDEFIAFCEQTGIAPSVVLNVGSGTPWEAADWILYCLARGIPVAAWDVGNEEHFWHNQVPGMNIAKTEEEYIAFYRELYAILQAELTPEQLDGLSLGAIGLPASHPLCVRKAWDRTILQALGGQMDYLDVHIGYATYNVDGADNDSIAKALMASAEWVHQMLEDVKREIDRYAGEEGEHIAIHISEHGPMTASFHYNTVAGALFQADLFNMLLREPKVTAANHLPAINHYAAANVVGTADFPVVEKNRGRVFWKNAVSYVFDLYAPLAGQEVLKTSVKAGTFDSPRVGLVRAMNDVPLADAAAYRDADGALTLMLLNRDTAQAQDFAVALPAAFALNHCQRLYSKNCFAYNSWNRDSVCLAVLDASEASMDGQTLMLPCPPMSLTVMQLAPQEK